MLLVTVHQGQFTPRLAELSLFEPIQEMLFNDFPGPLLQSSQNSERQ